MRFQLLSLSRSRKRIIGVLFDTLSVWGCLWLTFYLRLGISNPFQEYLPAFLVATATSVPFFIRFGLYRAVLRYMGSDSIVTIFKACSLATLCLMLGGFLLGQNHVPRSIPFIYWSLLLIVMTVTRYVMRSWLLGQTIVDIFPEFFNHKTGHAGHGIPVAIFGAGSSGVQLMVALDKGIEYQPVAFLDDDSDKTSRVIQGNKIYAPTQFKQMIQERGAQEILLAIPSATRARRREIVQSLEQYGLPIRTVPAMADLASGRMKMQEIQHVDIGDVLGREEVAADSGLLQKCILGKTVMITGAGGSIGSELSRQILSVKPEKIVLFEHCEFNLYAVEQDLLRIRSTLPECSSVSIIPILGSINNPARLLEAMNRFSVETIYHAAAYKHVPMVEHNIEEGLRNNTLGTLYTAQAAILAGVERFVLISTDKAVRPTNIMGASKRLAEMSLQALADQESLTLYNSELYGPEYGSFVEVHNRTCFSMVRFGNVLGSSGSVIPLFREQIRTGGPVTVTHPEINRYFMTIPEAAQLVIQAGAMASGGEVFVLDMGQPIKIIDLAKRMIVLSGLTVKDEFIPDGDIEIIFSGLRPGEKLYEELLIGDNVAGTDHQKISQAMESKLNWFELTCLFSNITESMSKNDFERVRDLLREEVDGFLPSSGIVDWMAESSVTNPGQESLLSKSNELRQNLH